ASLFIQKGYTLSQDTINLCNKYPNLFLDIDNITFENHKEFFRRERELFNQYYLNRIQQEVTR
ncbi:MAG: hypothetical protein ACRDAG_00620, partial [Cetobacterium somerae]